MLGPKWQSGLKPSLIANENRPRKETALRLHQGEERDKGDRKKNSLLSSQLWEVVALWVHGVGGFE